MDLLIDTQALVWLRLGSQRLGRNAYAALGDATVKWHVSAVTACEYADLNRRGRFGVDLPLEEVLVQLQAPVLDFPAGAWRLIETMPALHRDPVDRMMVAHAIHAGMTVVSADATVRKYPVSHLW